MTAVSNDETYRLFTTMLDPIEVPRWTELAAAYAQRWEIEIAFDELKTHQRGPRTVLRSKSPDLVLQEIWGHLCCHYAIRTPDVRGRRPRRRSTPTGSVSSPLCASPASRRPPRAHFPPDQHDCAPGWHDVIRRLIRRLNPARRHRSSPRVIKRKMRQMARQTRPPRPTGPNPPDHRPPPSPPLTERYWA